MEPLTHLLTGACLARTGFNRKTALATAAIAISAEIADIDILYELGGPVSGFQHHRGWTHSFVGVPAMAALSVAVVLGLDWFLRMRNPKPRKVPLRYGWLFAGTLLGGLCHILLDFTNSYGVRPLLPFSYRWYHWDIVSIIEPVMLLILVGGLVLPKLFALIQEEIGARRKPVGQGGAITALVLIAAMWGIRDYEHRRAIAAMSALEYGEGLPIRLSAFPAAGTPFSWYGVVENERSFVSFEVDSLKPVVDPGGRARTWRKPQETPASLAARKTELGRVYLDWADYPMMQTEPVISTGGARVNFVDLRYAAIRPSALSAAEVFDSDLRLTGIIMGGYFHPRRLRLVPDASHP